jgi:hypothetical protein
LHAQSSIEEVVMRVAHHLNIDQAVIPNWLGEGPDILPK